jgi:hypothetical protein
MVTLFARLLGAAGLLSGLLFASLALFAADTPGLHWIAASAALGLGGWLGLDWPLVSGFFASRGGRSQAASATLILLVAGICGLVSYVGEQRPKRWDHTETGMHSLTEQGRGVLASLPDTLRIEIVAFYVSMGDRFQESQRQGFRSLAEAARAHRPSMRFELVDPETNPARAAMSGITANATVIVSMTPSTPEAGPARSETLQNPDESDLINALLRLHSNERPAIYVITGHGEVSLSGSGAEGLGLLARRLGDLGFEVSELDTLRGADIPQDARLLILAGPQVPMTAPEAAQVRTWVEAGGSLLVCSEPKLPGDERQDAGRTGLEDALAAWGLQAADDLIFDEVMRRALGDATFPISERFALHEITRDLRLPLVLGTARSIITAEDAPSGAALSALAMTSAAAWGETRLDAESYSPDEEDHLGPVTLAAAAEISGAGDQPGRVVLVGDRDWLADGLLGEFGNLDFATRTIGYLARRSELIEIPPRGQLSGSLSLTFLQELLVIITAVLLVPGAFLLGSLVVWGWRKSL